LGIILYEMVTGKVPHKADSMVRTLAMQMLDPIVPPTQLRPDLAQTPSFEPMLMKMLAKKREQRYAKMDEVLRDLEATAGGSIKLEQPVSASVQNLQPAYTVGPLPPGADPSALAPSLPTVRSPVGVDSPTKGSIPPPKRGGGSSPPMPSGPSAP